MATEKGKSPKKKNIDRNGFPRRRIRFGITLSVMGFTIFLLGIRPGMFLLDRSPVIGFVQLTVMLIGLALICIGGTICMRGLWKDYKPNLAADIGIRLMSTGFVIAIFATLADIIGLGSHPYPQSAPYFGEWQALGVEIAEGIIALGLLLMIPYHRHNSFKNSKHRSN